MRSLLLLLFRMKLENACVLRCRLLQKSVSFIFHTFFLFIFIESRKTTAAAYTIHNTHMRNVKRLIKKISNTFLRYGFFFSFYKFILLPESNSTEQKNHLRSHYIQQYIAD